MIHCRELSSVVTAVGVRLLSGGTDLFDGTSSHGTFSSLLGRIVMQRGTKLEVMVKYSQSTNDAQLGCETKWKDIQVRDQFCVKMKNFEDAYNLLDEMRESEMRPTAQLYNAIIAGCFRENNVCKGLAVLKQMKTADAEP